jgi:hypothetical protein
MGDGNLRVTAKQKDPRLDLGHHLAQRCPVYRGRQIFNSTRPQAPGLAVRCLDSFEDQSQSLQCKVRVYRFDQL